MLAGATPTSSLVLGEIAICDGGCPPASKETTVMVDDISARKHLWIFEIDSKQIA
jgi:hypothetical protein